jgi:predicted glycoside hydrolase/deacetylase ChbG (UPF0249 family)
MDASRVLVVVADDYGIGPETSRGILELAAEGVITGTVLMVNSPYAEDAVRAWRTSGVPLEVGWHPVLTQDPPIAPAASVPSLVGPDGCLWPLGKLLTRLYLYRIRPAEIEIELRAQYRRFVDLVGRPPTLVNSHQHVALFPPIGDILLKVLEEARPLPFVRRIREPRSMLARIPGARFKRTVLDWQGRRLTRKQVTAGFPGASWLAGITDPVNVTDPAFFRRWLKHVPGRVVELACHPGYHDTTLIGRDCKGDDEFLQRRVDELHLLRQPSFLEACRRAGFQRLSAASFLACNNRGSKHAA